MSFGCRTVFRALVAFSALVLTGPVLHAQVLVTDWASPTPPPYGRLTNYDPSGSSTPLSFSLVQPTGMAMGPDGLLYVSNAALDSVDKYNPVTGAYVGNAVSSATLGAGFQPTGLAFGPGGELYVSKQAGFPGAGPGTGGVYRYNPAGPSLTPIITNITQAEGIAIRNGFLFAGELNNYVNGGRIWKYDLSNGNTSIFVDQTGTSHAPTGMIFGPDGMLYVADVTGFEIHKYDPNNAANNSTVVLGGAGLNSPTGVAFFGNSMYVSNFGTFSANDGFLSRYDNVAGNYVYNSNVVTGLFAGSAVVAVPEPTSMALMLVPIGGWLVRRRLAKKK